MPALDINKEEIQNDIFRIHFVNVGHGDAIILEFPDYPDFGDETTKYAHYGIVDTGTTGDTKDFIVKYLETLIKLRNLEYRIDFVCVTHPHADHYGGLKSLLDGFDGKIRQFWDSGFRTAAINYNKRLEKIAKDNRILFVRPAAGTEFEFGEVRIYTLAPSLDLRNRFDTYGVNRNNASIVLKLQFNDSIAILAGDAPFDSWGKIVEEFPRSSKITFHTNASVTRSEGNNQLNCQLLKVSHHGSKHGTSLEYLEKLTPTHFMVTCAAKTWYENNEPRWGSEWPHDLTQRAIKVLNRDADIKYSYKDKNVVYKLNGTKNIDVSCVSEDIDDSNFASNLLAIIK
jgi:competence protein ComEC